MILPRTQLAAKPQLLIDSEVPKLRVRVHTREKVFTEFGKEWSALAEKSAQTLCMSPEWAICWWRHFGQNKHRSLYVVTIHDGAKLVAIFPFYKGVTIFTGKIIDQRLQLIGSGGSKNEAIGFLDDYGISDFMDLLVDPDYHEAVVKVFFSLIQHPNFSDCVIKFHEVREDSFVKRFLYPRLLTLNWPVKIEPSSVCPIINVSESNSIDTFIKQSKSNARRRFRQTLRAIGTSNGYKIEEATTLEEVFEMVDNLSRLHQERWNRLGFPGTFHDPRFVRFFNDIVRISYPKNQLWIKQAVDSSGVCAVRMLLKYNGAYYDYMSGFNENSPSSKYRPGIGLLLNLIEDCFSQSIEHIELLRGEESYKYDFTEGKLQNWKISIPAQTYRHGFGKLSVKALYLVASFYKHIKKEFLLLNVQFQKAGFFVPLANYLEFRSTTIKAKIGKWIPKRWS